LKFDPSSCESVFKLPGVRDSWIHEQRIHHAIRFFNPAGLGSPVMVPSLRR
jgi:hypothetical protein